MSQIDYEYFFGKAAAFGLDVIDYRGKWVHPSGKQWRRRQVEDIQGLVVHQTAGGDNVDRLGEYHTGQLGKVHIGDGTGLPGIAYAMFVNKAGQLYLVNDIEAVTWSHGDVQQIGDENKMFMGVCFGGRFVAHGWSGGTEHPTDAQIETFHKLWAFIMDGFHLTELDLYGHYDFGKSTCPGDHLQILIEAYNAKITPELDTDTQRQQALADLGYTIDVDGQWGRNSNKTMQKFQRDRGLPITGDWTKLTTASVYRALRRRQE